MRTMQYLFPRLLLCGLLTALPSWASAQEDKVNPLFPVGLEHEFPNAAETFDEIRQLILDNYYSQDISEEALYWAAIKGMLRHISPPTNPELGRIWTAEEYQKILDNLQGVQVSIGVKSSFNPNEGSLTISEVLDGSPAESILQPFDRIMRIDGETLKGKDVSAVNALLNGDEGTNVTLTINRDIKVFDVTLTREKFNNQNLIVTPLTDTIALVEMKSFSSDISKQTAEEMDKLRDQGIESIILDFRNNTGGVFMEALRTAEIFLPQKSILLRTYTREKKLQNYVSSNADPDSFKVAVLVNGNTASAAEIVASSLRDHKVGFIVGTKTHGKGVFETTFTLENDYRVKFITGAMYTPKGAAWQGKGLTPDFLIEQDTKTLAALLKIDPRQRLNKDVAMITAFKLLQGYDN